jgi:hypothetical protein
MGASSATALKGALAAGTNFLKPGGPDGGGASARTIPEVKCTTFYPEVRYNL